MTRLSRRSGFVLTLTALVVAALAPASAYGASPSAAATAAPAPAAKTLKVIVTFDAKPGKAATKAIERVGGKVKHQLKLIDALSAEIPRAKLKALRADPAVKTVELDGKLVMSDHAPTPATTSTRTPGASSTSAAARSISPATPARA